MAGARPPELAWRPVLAVGLGAATLLLAVANRYGFHRDELYFLEAGQHLALGYVDQPPLTPALARLQVALFGSSPWSLRVLPALTIVVVVVLAAMLAQRVSEERGPVRLLTVHVATSAIVALPCSRLPSWCRPRSLGSTTRGGDHRLARVGRAGCGRHRRTA